jgi:hypothetical protein
MPLSNTYIDLVPPPSTTSLQVASDALIRKRLRNHIRSRIAGGLWLFNLAMLPVIILLAIRI